MCQLCDDDNKAAVAQSRAEVANLTDVFGILRENGYQVVFGADAVRAVIAASSDGSAKLCSGYRVFPGGDKCHGCTDCTPNVKLTGCADSEGVTKKEPEKYL